MIKRGLLLFSIAAAISTPLANHSQTPHMRWVWCVAGSARNNTYWYSEAFKTDVDPTSLGTAFYKHISANGAPYDAHPSCLNPREDSESSAENDRDEDAKKMRDRNWRIVMTRWVYR